MFKPENIPQELPEEVKSVMASLKPEPPALLEKRKRLLAELTSQVASSTGALQQLLSAVQEVLLAMQPEVPFKASLAEDFDRALRRYAQELPKVAPPPPLLAECMNYLRERVEAMGLGNMLEKARAASAQAQPTGKRSGG